MQVLILNGLRPAKNRALQGALLLAPRLNVSNSRPIVKGSFIERLVCFPFWNWPEQSGSEGGEMRASVFVGTSVDGFLARPDGALDFLDEGGNEPHGFEEFFASVDALVIGRGTFETVLGSRSGRTARREWWC